LLGIFFARFEEMAFDHQSRLIEDLNEFLHDHSFLDGAQILIHGLFKDLGGDTTELAGIEFDFHEFADVDGGFNGAGFDDRDFVGVGTGAIGSFEFGKHLNFA
jgi:hypothetical protein